jgi:hypothetical protein
MRKRGRFKNSTTLKERLVAKAKALREGAAKLPPGFKRDSLLSKARKDDTAPDTESWINSPGLRPPT